MQAYNSDLQTFNPETQYNYYNQINTSFEAQNGLINNVEIPQTAGNNVSQVQINQMNYGYNPVYNNYNPAIPAVPAVYATNYNTATTAVAPTVTSSTNSTTNTLNGQISLDPHTGLENQGGVPITTYIAEAENNDINQNNKKNDNL